MTYEFIASSEFNSRGQQQASDGLSISTGLIHMALDAPNLPSPAQMQNRGESGITSVGTPTIGGSGVRGVPNSSRSRAGLQNLRISTAPEPNHPHGLVSPNPAVVSPSRSGFISPRFSGLHSPNTPRLGSPGEPALPRANNILSPDVLSPSNWGTFESVVSTGEMNDSRIEHWPTKNASGKIILTLLCQAFKIKLPRWE